MKLQAHPVDAVLEVSSNHFSSLTQTAYSGEFHLFYMYHYNYEFNLTENTPATFLF